MSLSTSSSADSATRRTLRLPSTRVLVGLAYVLCVVVSCAVLGTIVLVSGYDHSDPQNNWAAFKGIGVLGTAGLVVCSAVGYWCSRSAARSRVGALVLGALSVVTLVFFWCGVPGMLGATAAGLGGLTRGSRPQTGAARVAGLIGLFVAALNVVLSLGGFVVSGFHG